MRLPPGRVTAGLAALAISVGGAAALGAEMSGTDAATATPRPAVGPARPSQPFASVPAPASASASASPSSSPAAVSLAQAASTPPSPPTTAHSYPTGPTVVSIPTIVVVTPSLVPITAQSIPPPSPPAFIP